MGAYLDVLALFEASSFTEEWPHDETEWIKLANDGVGIHGLDGGKDDELVL